MPHVRFLVLGVGMLAVVGLSVLIGYNIVSAGNHQPTVRIVGTEQFKPNALFSSSFHFAPGDITVNSGDEVTWVHQEQIEAPHTISVLDADDVPDTLPEVALCGVCDPIIGAHIGGGTDEIGLGDGLNESGDSFVIATEFDFGLGAPSEKTVAVTADPGTTLHYICAIHPWMQGTIEVVE